MTISHRITNIQKAFQIILNSDKLDAKEIDEFSSNDDVNLLHEFITTSSLIQLYVQYILHILLH